MKKTISTALVFLAATSVFAQANVDYKTVVEKTVQGYQTLLNSKELKDCKTQTKFRRLSSNSCNKFINLSDVALLKLGNSVDRNAQELNDTDKYKVLLLVNLSREIGATHVRAHAAQYAVAFQYDAQHMALDLAERLEIEMKRIEKNY